MLEEFLSWMRDECCLAENTLKNYSILARYLHKNNAIGLDIGKQEFLAFCHEREDEGAMPETRCKYVKVAKKWCQFHHFSWGEELKMPRRRRHRMPTPNFETVMEFLEQYTGEMWQIYWLLHINCGTRPSEIRTLEVSDFDFEQRCFYPKQTKEDDNSAIIIFDWLMPTIIDYCHKIGSGYLFSSKFSKGEPVSLAAVEKDCRKRLAMMGCMANYTPHSFRRAYATIGHIRGQMPLVMLQRILRHSDSSVTTGYIDGDPDYVREAANMHPYNHFHCNPDVIVKEVEDLIRRKLDDPERFDQKMVRELTVRLYETIKT